MSVSRSAGYVVTDWSLGTARRAAVTVLALIIVAACYSSQLSGNDAHSLARVRAEFGGRYIISPDGDLYLRARARPNMEVAHSDLERIYETFFTDSTGERRDTRFVYLNAYDARGRFVIQVTRNRGSGEFRYYRTEHY